MGQGNALDVGRLQIIKAVIDAGAAIKVLDRSYIDLATPMGRGFMAMMSAMAEDERLRIIKRTHEGRQIARAKGVRMGRKPKLTPHQMKEARQRLAKGEPTRSLAKATASASARFRGWRPESQWAVPLLLEPKDAGNESCPT